MKRKIILALVASLSVAMLLTGCTEKKDDQIVQASRPHNQTDEETDDNDDADADDQVDTSLSGDVTSDDESTYEYVYTAPEGTWQEAYYNFLCNTLKEREENYDTSDNWYQDEDYAYAYYLYDMTGDGIPELIIKNGSCEADYNDRVFTYKDNGKVECLGTIPSGHSVFYSADDGALVRSMGHMGYIQFDMITYEDNELKTELIYEDSGYTDDGEWIEDYEYPATSDIVAGAKYLDYADIDNYILIEVYGGQSLEYEYDKMLEDEDYAKQFYESVIDHNNEVYAVGDGYMKDVGLITFDDLLEDGVMYDYTDGDVRITGSMVADVDHNGSYEMVLFFNGEYGYGYTGILSEQEGVIYCYLSFSPHSDELSDDGYMLAYGVYKTMPCFYKSAIFWKNNY